MKLIPILLLVVACTSVDVNETRALELSKALAVACPIADEADTAARDACADALARMPELRGALATPMLWGGEPADVAPADLGADAHLTEFEPLVWRRVYLSTFMFSGEAPTIERSRDVTVLRVPVRFRRSMDAGEYPYPFWHADSKWRAYETSTHIVFVFAADGSIPVVVRSAAKDMTRSHVDRMWDGAWSWDGGAQPRVTLYRYLLSSANPFVAELDTAYRALEEGMRESDCAQCHSPNNALDMKHLELLNYPNQALAGRHDIIRQLEANRMPPNIGITDPLRGDLIELARTFADAGDRALAFENE